MSPRIEQERIETNLDAGQLPHFTVDLLDRRDVNLTKFDNLAKDLLFDPKIGKVI